MRSIFLAWFITIAAAPGAASLTGAPQAAAPHASVPPASVPPASVPPASAPSASAKVWEGRAAEYEAFIAAAPIERFEDLNVGVTHPKRAFLQPGGLVES